MRKLSDELTKALRRARIAWIMTPLTGAKYIWFEDMAKERYGIQLYRQNDMGFSGYDIVDDQKFSMFLLTWT